jgi:shikimate dehydrogenase
MSEPLCYAVAGRPVGHSLSPLVFKTLFTDLGESGIYLRLASADVHDLFAVAAAMRLQGLNVTSPFKEAVLSLVENADEAARKIGAVNCLVREGATFKGYNTDHIGVVGALETAGFCVRAARAVVLGAGGAARAAAYGLTCAGAERVTIVNRTGERAAKAAAMIGCESLPLAAFDGILHESDLLVSCVPSGGSVRSLSGNLGHLTVLDADYRNPSLGRVAAAAGCSVVDGRQWLLHQALPSFKLLTGRDAPAGSVRRIASILEIKPEPRKKHLALIGFMGAGKTTAGRLLAEKLGRNFTDTDRTVEHVTGMNIPEIFGVKGETFFRTREREVIGDAVADPSPSVISLGGGAVLDDVNVRRVRGACRVVWLWVSPETAMARIPSMTRPLFDPDYSRPGAAKLLAGRLPFYAGACDFVVNADQVDPEVVAERIAHEMD